ncbi:hypothetical protein JCM6882_005969 [Rhodosporidiobolus microsporus]
MAEPTKEPKKSLFDLTPEQQKKATLIFLVSLGTTLLITGRSGGKLLKRAKASEASAPPAAAAPPPLKAASKPVAPKPAPPPPRPTPAVQQPPVSLKLPAAPPASFLHPNSLTPPKPRRLLPSFVSSPSSISQLPTRPAPSAYFLPNPTLLQQSTTYANELDKLDKLHEEGSADLPPPIEDGFNPAVHAAKALAIATAITFTSFGVGIYGLMRYLEVDDLESLALALNHHVSPVLDANRPSIPAWALPSPKSDSLDLSSPSTTAQDDADLSYWESVKEALDKEAEEDRVERRSAWERMRRRAEELKGKAASA